MSAMSRSRPGAGAHDCDEREDAENCALLIAQSKSVDWTDEACAAALVLRQPMMISGLPPAQSSAEMLRLPLDASALLHITARSRRWGHHVAQGRVFPLVRSHFDFADATRHQRLSARSLRCRWPKISRQSRQSLSGCAEAQENYFAIGMREPKVGALPRFRRCKR